MEEKEEYEEEGRNQKKKTKNIKYFLNFLPKIRSVFNLHGAILLRYSVTPLIA